MNARISSNSLWLVALTIVFAFITQITHLEVIKTLDPNSEEANARRFVTDPEIMKAFSLGFNRVLSDFWWLAFVQYYGDRKAVQEERLKYAPFYLRNIVTLDPHFIRPYWFASFVFAGELKRVKEAADILDQGIRNNPDDWSLPFIAGFNQSIYNADYKKAAYYYRIAANVKGAPNWLLEQAKIMETDAPALIKELRTWERLYKEGDSMVKSKALTNLEVLWSKVYWEAPNDAYRQRALAKLEQYGLKLQPKR